MALEKSGMVSIPAFLFLCPSISFPIFFCKFATDFVKCCEMHLVVLTAHNLLLNNGLSFVNDRFLSCSNIHYDEKNNTLPFSIFFKSNRLLSGAAPVLLRFRWGCYSDWWLECYPWGSEFAEQWPLFHGRDRCFHQPLFRSQCLVVHFRLHGDRLQPISRLSTHRE